MLIPLIPNSFAAGKKSSPSFSPQMHFDANDVYIHRDGKRQVFEGEVVGMVAGVLIMADKITLDRIGQFFEAEGHVILVSMSHVFGGDKAAYHIDNGDFSMDNAFVISQDPGKKDAIIQKILGMTRDEILVAFEKDKQLRILAADKSNLKKEFIHTSKDSPERQVLIDRLAVLLEKEKLIRTQENPVLASMDPKHRESLKSRRLLWEESKKEAVPVPLPILFNSYLRLSGDQIARENNYHIMGKNIFLTPCFCDEASTPDWNIRADSMDAFIEGYADLENPVIEVKGIPILYLPYIKIPTKNERQSGFLLPNLTYGKENGTTYSQPMYFALSDDSDSTVTADFVEKRGFRLGTEFRYQQKSYSGWQIETEILRDKKWLNQKEERTLILDSYQEGLSIARAKEQSTPIPDSHPLSRGYDSPLLSDPSWWKKNGYDLCLQDKNSERCNAELDSSLGLPENLWRYKLEWKGQTFFAPRLSFVSSGRYLSDHRYEQDRYVIAFDESLNLKDQPRLFSKTNWQVHLDGKDFYLGTGSRFADPMTAHKRFFGYQIPMVFKTHSRMFSLFESVAPRPIYANMSLTLKRLVFVDDENPRMFPVVSSEKLNLGLDSGHWMQGKISLISPLTKKQIFRLNYFTDLEVRGIQTRLLTTNNPNLAYSPYSPVQEENYSSIRTAKMGFDFVLPMDGLFRLQKNDKLEDENSLFSEDFLQHRMDWGMTFSLRPSVIRQGQYGEIYNVYDFNLTELHYKPTSSAQLLNYFESDEKIPSDSEHVSEEDKMYPHQKIIFSTSHDFSLFKKVTKFLPKSNPRTEENKARVEEPVEEEVSYHDQAEDILLKQEHRIQTYQKFVDDKVWAKTHLIKIETDHRTPVHFDASLSYDYFLEKKRQQQTEYQLLNPDELITLVEPWSPLRSGLSLRLGSWQLDFASKYNIYSKVMNQLDSTLFFPSLFYSQFSLGYNIEKEVKDEKDGGISINLTKTRRMSLLTDLFPNTQAKLDYAIRSREQVNPKPEYFASMALDYASTSQCWGWRFFWKRDFAEITWDGTYYLSFVVKFFNYRREYGNVMSKYNEKS